MEAEIVLLEAIGWQLNVITTLIFVSVILQAVWFVRHFQDK